ncbi:mechanosensitive ion channel family protein [Acidocella facilis]|uniref:mechanosensitive ion channel family protein n=1 Tax=Acidocella facilis TaxID=525 RepID=UPI00054FE1D9|nr:mechanosensitive ion channel domain-containing protein [Acidocella facilis]
MIDHARTLVLWLYNAIPDPVVGTAMLVLAALVAMSLCRWVFARLSRIAGRFGNVPQMLMARSKGPTCALLVLLAVSAVLPLAPLPDNPSSILGHLLVAAFVLVLGWTLMNTVELFADLYIKRIHFEDDSNNLVARKQITQVGILRTAVRTLLVLLTVSLALMTSSAVRQYGVSLFASAGAAGLVVGLAARPLLSNLLAGIQIGLTQPIRLEDSVVVQGEWGWIERIGATYVVIRIWDLRRLIVPLSYFIEQPFQNWTHSSADLMGTVMLYVDYSVPLEQVRQKLREVVEANPRWDRKVAMVQMTDLPNAMVELRLLVSARNAGVLWDLRCDVREAMVTWLVREYPGSLPRRRLEMAGMPERAGPGGAFVAAGEMAAEPHR